MTAESSQTDAHPGYNERLFSGGFRGWLHFARFRYLAEVLRARHLEPKRVIELGCYDGKTLRFLPSLPERYVGLDADWEGGLEIGAKNWAAYPNFEFRRCQTPAEWPTETGFDLGICMETLEHVPPEMLDGYLEKMAASVNGHVFVTVPTEKGVVFAAKYLAKMLVVGDLQRHTFSEFMHSTLGQSSKVPRDQHKGFDYATVIAAMARHFDIVSVRAYPFTFLPRPLGFGVAILGRTRQPKGR